MIFSSICVQINTMFTKKEFKVAAVIALFYSCFAFAFTLTEFSGIDISKIKDANQLVCFSQSNRLWFFFSLLYPFLLVLPFSTSYIDDYKNQLLPVYISRTSRTIYYVLLAPGAHSQFGSGKNTQFEPEQRANPFENVFSKTAVFPPPAIAETDL